MTLMISGQPARHRGPTSHGCFTVKNAKGLHTRPSTELVKEATKYRSQILLKLKNTEVNAKSLLGILSMAAGKGTEIKVEATGDDSASAVHSLLALADNQFHISY